HQEDARAPPSTREMVLRLLSGASTLSETTPMLTLQWIELRCPLCDSTFESMAAMAEREEGLRYIEMSVAPTDAAVLPFLVHVCNRCGYAGGIEHFEDGVEISPLVRDLVWSELAPKLGAASRISWLAVSVPGSEKYEGAARIAEWRDADARTI